MQRGGARRSCLNRLVWRIGLSISRLLFPAGLVVYTIAGGHLNRAAPPTLSLIAVIPATLLTVAALTALPARIAANRSVADVLRAE